MRDAFEWSDEAIKRDTGHDDGYRGIDPALHHHRMNSPFPVRGHDASPGWILEKDTHNDQKKGREEAGGEE